MGKTEEKTDYTITNMKCLNYDKCGETLIELARFKGFTRYGCKKCRAIFLRDNVSGAMKKDE